MANYSPYSGSSYGKADLSRYGLGGLNKPKPQAIEPFDARRQAYPPSPAPIADAPTQYGIAAMPNYTAPQNSGQLGMGALARAMRNAASSGSANVARARAAGIRDNAPAYRAPSATEPVGQPVETMIDTSPTAANMRQWGVTPRDVALGQNAAYGNVANDLTGASQALVRAQVANRYDPQSWMNATVTPGEQQQETARRTEEMLASLQPRTQGPLSPLAGSMPRFEALARQDAAKDAEYLARREASKQRMAERDMQLVDDPVALQRMRAMTYNNNLQSVDPQQYRQELANATAKYALYSRGAMAGGTKPLSFDEFLLEYGRPDGMSGAVNSNIEAGRSSVRTENDTRTQALASNPLGAMLAARRYGILPQDTDARARITEGLAMSGNPVAYGMRTQDVNEAGQNYRADLADKGMTRRVELEQQGLTERDKPQLPVISPQDRLAFYGLLEKTNPTNAGQSAYDTVVKNARESGRWDMPGERQKILAEAQDAASKAAAIATATQNALRNDPVFSQFFAPQTAATPTPPQSGMSVTTTSNPPSAPSAVPAPPASPVPVPQPGEPGYFAALAKNNAISGLKTADPLEGGVPTAPPPKPPANQAQALQSYRDLKASLGGRNPTPDEFAKYLAKQNLSIPQVPREQRWLKNYPEPRTDEWRIPPGLPGLSSKPEDFDEFVAFLEANPNAFGQPYVPPTTDYRRFASPM